MFIPFLAFSLSIVLSLILFPSIIRLANKIGFVDHPSSERKLHKKATPVIGGILIGFIVVVVFVQLALFTKQYDPFYFLTLAIFTLFVIVGVIDDRVDIAAKKKFIFQILCALLVVRSGLSLNSINLILKFDIPHWAIELITVLVIVGALNAYNLVDGIDGLLGGFLTIGFGWLLLLAFLLGEGQMTWLLLSVLGGLIVFLKYNLSSSKKVFMGDAGSVSLGFLLIVFSIHLFEKSYHEHAQLNWMGMGIVAVLSVPIMDTIIVFSRRINLLGSPFKADRTHLHHLVVNIRSEHKYATGIILILAISLFVFTLFLSAINAQGKTFLIIPFIMLVVYYVINKINLFKESQTIIQNLEKN